LRVEVEVDEDGVVREAYASGQLFRGIEMILKERDPRDAGLLAGGFAEFARTRIFVPR